MAMEPVPLALVIVAVLTALVVGACTGVWWAR